MAKKQLDFDAPLLSVRRFSPTLTHSNQNTLPNRRHELMSVKSEINLDHITERVAVPFKWEHIPGQSKSNSGPQPQRRYLDESPVFLSLYPQKFEYSKEGVNVNDNDTYSDALDELSQLSFSQNCSVSGISGSDGFDEKPARTFSADPQTRDFMMRRFLPAAKAMTLETPHYVSRKSSMVPAHEQPSEVKKIVYEDSKPLVIEHNNNNNKLRYLPYVEQSEGDEESESEDVDYVDDSVIVPVKSCTFLPWFCSKKSVCLLNPVPSMKHVMHYPKASIVSVARRRKISISGPLCRNTDELASNAIIKRKVDVARIKQTVKDNHIRLHPLRKFLDEASVSLHPATESIRAPKKGETYKMNRPNMKNKGGDSFQRRFSHHSNERGSDSFSPAVEKTLYIDPINIVEYSKPRPKIESACQYLNFDILGERIERKTIAETLIEDINTESVSKGSTISEVKVSDISYLQDQTETTKAIKEDNDHLHLESRSSLDCLDIKPDVRNNSHVSSSVQYTLPPPLPKSPTESWLWRYPSSTGAKWENIVKTSYLHHDHVHYSELVDQVRNS